MRLKLSTYISSLRLGLLKVLIGKSTVIANCTFADDVYVYSNNDSCVIGNTFNGNFTIDFGDQQHKDGEQ